MLKTKIIFYSVVMLTIASCKQEVKVQPTASVQEEVIPGTEVHNDGAILEAFVGNEQVVFTNDADKSSKDLVYYDHSAIEESGLNFQIGGNAPYGSVVGIGLSTIQVGTYEFSRENKKIFTVDIGIGSADKEPKFERSDKGSINITKSEKNLVSGNFSGTGLTLISDESPEFTSVKIHGTFENIPLIQTPK